MEQKIDYNAIARIYAANRSASPAVLGRILEGLDGHPVRDVLEIGCGTADYLHALSQALGVNGRGFDQSAGMLEAAGSKNPGLALQQGDASGGFPYPSAAFDLAYSVDVIHYIPDLEHYFSEVWRVLRTGGLALTVTDSSDDIRRRTHSEYFPESCEVELKRYPTIERIQAAMARSGFHHTWTSHSERSFPMDAGRLERFRNKAFSSLRLIPEEAFQRGLARLEAAAAGGHLEVREVYTLVWGERD